MAMNIANLTLYGSMNSGNCLKPKWICDYHNIPYTWNAVDLTAGEARSDAFLALNPAGQVPFASWDDGRGLTQSNAIMQYLAEAVSSDLLPNDAFARAKMRAWLFWEQYSHEPYIAVRRSQLFVLGRPEAELDPALLEKGSRALTHMEHALDNSPYLGSETPTLADVGLLAYTRWADQGGFDMTRYPNVQVWIKRCEALLKLA